MDFPTLSALNPHLSPELEEVKEREKPEEDEWWDEESDELKEERQAYYQETLEHWREYDNALRARQKELPSAAQELTKTVRDLERRGLLQYDAMAKRYDLHPVVRGIATGALRQKEKEQYGQRVVDHFSQEAHIPYDKAETLDDVRHGLHVVRALLQMGRHQQACDAYLVQLCNPLLFNLEANAEVLSVERPFFPHGWGTLPDGLAESDVTHLASDAAVALSATGALKEALECYGAVIMHCLRRRDLVLLQRRLLSVTDVLDKMNRSAKAEKLVRFALELATPQGGPWGLFRARLFRFNQLTRVGRFGDAESIWHLLDPMGRAWPRSYYRPGEAEGSYAWFRFHQGTLKEQHLTLGEQLAKVGKNRRAVRSLHRLRGEWRLEQGQWALGVDSLHEAVRLAREVGQTDAAAETQLALAKFHLNQLLDPRQEAEQLANTSAPAHRFLADLWLAIGDAAQAKKHALAAYKCAWADGEPYVQRYELDKARGLLERLGAEIPELPQYDPAKDEKFPWEDELTAAIEKLRAEKEAEKLNEKNEERE